MILTGRIQRALAAAALVAAGLLAAACDTAARQTPLAADETSAVALAELPRQAHDTWRLIHSGGPFPYEKDGQVFGNRERLLPRQPRGYWREYTVRTPGAQGRGARRIVCGGARPTKPDACYYTADHYSSFKKITP
ncbi:MAG: ribonuclease N1 [Ottowia sp.]|nr:ribonuclease N1 [Ottowia sp.]